MIVETDILILVFLPYGSLYVYYCTPEADLEKIRMLLPPPFGLVFRNSNSHFCHYRVFTPLLFRRKKYKRWLHTHPPQKNIYGSATVLTSMFRSKDGSGPKMVSKDTDICRDTDS